jgi:hypothetical protein
MEGIATHKYMAVLLLHIALPLAMHSLVHPKKQSELCSHCEIGSVQLCSNATEQCLHLELTTTLQFLRVHLCPLNRL